MQKLCCVRTRQQFSASLDHLSPAFQPISPSILNHFWWKLYHVDNLKSSQIDPKVNDEFLQWIRDTFGQLGEVKMTQGPLHNYLGMTLDYFMPGQVSIDMSHYVKKMVKEFPQENLKGVSVASPWNENLFKVQHDCVPF